MMGRQTGDQSQSFYLFNLEQRVLAGNLLRRINPVVSRILVELRDELSGGLEPHQGFSKGETICYASEIAIALSPNKMSKVPKTALSCSTC